MNQDSLGSESVSGAVSTSIPSAIGLVSIDELSPYERNAKTHGEKQIAALADSIEAFGLVGGIVVRNGVIAKGHGTLAAVRLLISRGEAIYPPPGKAGGAQPYPEGLVPVIDASGWSESQFRAYVLADNRLAEKSGWDRDILRLELTDLSLDGFDIDLTGFSAKDLDTNLDTNPQLGDGLAYKIIVDCENEEAQAALMKTLEDQGFSVRPLIA